ncbi:MAG: APC family permease [Actinomycetota bacterium]|nr:APC family permease [Actinomycetota bacterium]MDA2970974.1 APC family permease [Actinomycetota bacterium]MDA3001969.1 APC family permease [Actinomycetota bacterium]
MSENQPSQLPRVLGLVHVVASGVGIIVGAGIYVLLAPAAEDAGGLVWLSFVISAFVCAFTAMSYAELASMFPRTGGEYEYASHVFGRRVTFMIGWGMAAGLVIAGATVSLGFARYARYFWDVDDRWLALGILSVSSLLVIWGSDRWSKLVVVLSGAQVAGLLFVVIIGIGHLGDGELVTGRGGSGWNGFSGVMSAAALVFFAYIGFDEVATLSEETKDPTRITPRALLWSLGISAVLYVLVSVAAVNVLGAEGLAESTQPLTDVAADVVGGRAGSVMAVFAMLTTANTAILVLTAASRMFFAMSRAGDLPAAASRLSGDGTPVLAVVVASLVAAVFVLWGDLKLIASATDFAIYAIFLSVNVMVLVLRRRRPELERPFRSPWSLGGWPVLPILGFAITVWMIVLLEFDAILVGVGLFVLGAVVATARRSMADDVPSA